MLSSGKPISGTLAVAAVADPAKLPTADIVLVSAKDAEDTMRLAGTVEGLFCGPSSGGALWAALQLCRQVENATIVSIVCDRGDRYISTGVFPS